MPLTARKTLAWKILAIVFIIFDLILTIALFIVLARQNSIYSLVKSPTYQVKRGSDEGPARVRQRTLYPSNSLSDYSVFAPLSPDEQLRVRNFVHKRQGLKPYSSASLKDLSEPFIYLIELVMPDKSTMLTYLDGKRSSPPERSARVVIYNGGRSVIQEFEVGPVEHPTWIRPLPTCGGNLSEIPWTERPAETKEYSLLSPILMKEVAKGNEIWKKGFHTQVCDYLFPRANNGGKCLVFIDIAPRGWKAGQRKSWGFFLRTFDGYLLHPLPLMMLIQHEGTDPKKWGVLQVQYGNRKFKSFDELVSLYKSRKVDLITVPAYPQKKPIFSDMTYDANAKSNANKRGPKTVDGQRYNLMGNRISYLDWSADIGMRTGHGLALFDVRFAGERIAYEISNQEAAVMYSGKTAISGICQYFDNSWSGMGLWSHELVPGIDCPEGASFLDTAFFLDGNQPKVNRRAVCIFEWNTGIPLGRHTETDLGGTTLRYAGVPDHALVIRQVATVVNYDYVFDIILRLDGSIEVRIAATGFLQSGYILEVEQAPEVINNIIGQLHQHLFSWKVDLDIKGVQNAFSEISFPTEKIPHPAFPNEINRTILTHKYTLKRTEKEANVKYKFRHPKYYLLHANSTDKSGYRLIVDHMAFQPLPENDLAEYGASFARYPISITRRKERREDTSVNLYSQHNPFYPTAGCTLEKFYRDNEDIVNEDLVAWINQGIIHLPHTEDIPVTTTPTSMTRFILQPYNYFKISPMTRSKDTVILKPRTEGPGSFVTNYLGHDSDRLYRLMENFNGTFFYP